MVCGAVASICVCVHANSYGMVCKAVASIRAVASICVYVHAIATVWFVGLLLLFVSMFMQIATVWFVGLLLRGKTSTFYSHL